MTPIKIYRFKAFGFNDKIKDAIETCKHYGFSHIPIIEKGIFRGMLRCDDLIETEEGKLELLRDFIEKIYLSDKMTWMDTLALMIRNEANVLGVLDFSGKFVGIRLLDDIINYLAEKDFINKNGYVLVIKKNTADFSISEVTQIIESDGGFILGILINKTNGETELELKIQTEDINEIIQSFRRFDYTIISEIEEDLHLQELKEHSAFLKKYLEIGD